MTAGTIELRGKTDPVLCNCANELRRLKTLEISGSYFVFEGFFYQLADVADITEQEVTGIRLVSERRAVPVSLGERDLRASAGCTCGLQMTYALHLNGNQVLDVKTVTAYQPDAQ